MHAFGILLRKEVAESWRTRRAPVVLGLFFVMGMLAPLLARFTPEIVAASGGANLAAALPVPTTADAVDQFLKTIGQFGAFVAILLAMGSVAGDREHGTAALVLTKPVGRGAFLGAKLVALTALLGAAVAGLRRHRGGLHRRAVRRRFRSRASRRLSRWSGSASSPPPRSRFSAPCSGRSPAAAAGLGFAWVVLGGVAAAHSRRSAPACPRR